MAETGSSGVLGGADDGGAKLVVICGLPGAGKTTVGEAIADAVDGRLVRTDVVRKETLTEPQYSEAETQLVYEEAFRRARETLEEGGRVVIDGTFRDREYRIRALEAAEEVGADFQLVRVVCDEDVVRDRIADRVDDESDADFEIHRMFRETFDRVALQHVTIDNSGSWEETLRQIAVHF